ncbi:MAG: RNA 2',3'-cyclic phosphodiesterase [Bacteroidales bacterium]|nr:RNA 2',3'-cyclic phosphodiesterase [Bacteroidales bacterium]
MKRTFVAIKIEVFDKMEILINKIKEELKDEKIRWVDFKNLHLTLFFIGDTSEDLIHKVRKSLRANLSNIEGFNLNCESLGVFRNIYCPRAIWFGFKDSVKLQILKTVIDRSLKELGDFNEERAFKPHLTIGRTKDIKDKDKLKALMLDFENLKIDEFQIKEIIFYESILTSKGAIYKEIDKFQLS